MVNLPVYGEADRVPFPCFGIALSEDETHEDFVSIMEQEMREIVGDISNKEFLTQRAIAGTMPQLNHVFEELGIHHKEHKVPMKVLKSLEDKAKKATAKNTTAMVELKKRNRAGGSKIISKRQKIVSASAAASAGVDEEIAKNVGGGSPSAAASMEGEHSAASAALGSDDFIGAALQGMCASSTTKPFVVAPMPGVLGDESSGSEGEDVGGGGTYPPKDTKVNSVDRCRVAGALEVSKDKAEERSPPTRF
jgi:hypothetical protein